jgi:ABC-2 type transport system permease protein
MSSSLRNIKVVFKRELTAYFASPLAYVFIFIFVVLAMFLTFVVFNWLQRQDASLDLFFQMHPWLFMILGPAIGMRLWSEEHRQGTIELLLTMPVTAWQAITGKFIAACVVVAAALVLTFPIVWTVNYLGDPDMGRIFSGYLGSFLTGCTTIAITCVVSAFTRSQVACLVVSVCICFLLTMVGLPPVLDFFRDSDMKWLGATLEQSSLLSHLFRMADGAFAFQSAVYFVSVIAFCLYATSVIIRSKRA